MGFRRILAVLFLSLAFAASAHAQYPNKPVRIIVPFPPGGAVDVVARLVAQQISGPLGQNVFVENRTGAGSMVGTEVAARSTPDGYTLLMAAASSMVINPLLHKLPYDPMKAFEPISLVGYVPHVLVANPNLPAKDLKEFLAYAKAHPGQVNYGSAGNGTPHHIALEMFKQMAGVDLVHVPYNGTAPALAGLLGGQVSVMSSEIMAVLPHIKSGKLRAFGVATETRSPLAPEIVTIGEAGMPGFEVTSWFGVVAPTGVPKETLALLSNTIAKALTEPDMRDKLAQVGVTPVGGSAADFAKHLQRENAKWTKAVRDAGIMLN